MSIDEWALTRSLAALTAMRPRPRALSDQLGVLVSAAAELLGVDSVGILLLDDFDHVRTVAVSGPAAAALEQAQEQLQLGPGIDVFAARRVVAVVDLATDPDYERLWSELVDTGVRGVLSAPVIVRNEIVGNLNAITGQRHEWSHGRAPGRRCARRTDRAAVAHRDQLDPRCRRPSGHRFGTGDGGAGHVTTVDPEALGASLRRLKRRSEPAVLEQSLRQLVSACVGLFGYSGCGVMLADERGELHYAVANDETSQRLEEAQIATGQGPCVDTFVRDTLIASRRSAHRPALAGGDRPAHRQAGPCRHRRSAAALRGHRGQPRRVPRPAAPVGRVRAARADPLRRDRRRDAGRGDQRRAVQRAGRPADLRAAAPGSDRARRRLPDGP